MKQVVHSMGMIQVEGVTYRVGQVGPKEYEIVRLLDDIRLGSFQKEGTTITCRFVAGEDSLLRVARVAVRQGKTRWKPLPASRRRSPIGRMGTIAAFFLAAVPQEQ